MGIQSSVNGLIQQLYTIGAIGAVLSKQRKQVNEAQIQTDIAAGNATLTEDGKVDPEWLQKRRAEDQKRSVNGFYRYAFNEDGSLTKYVGEARARILENRVKRGIELYRDDDKKFYNNPEVQKYLKSFAANSELKNEVAGKVARSSVEARTASINKTKSNFDEHTASLIKYYSKGSGNP